MEEQKQRGRVLRFIALLCCFVVCGCGTGPTVVKRESVGKIKTASIPTTAFNEHIRMVVECENAIVVVFSTPTVPVGEIGEIVTMSDKSRWFTWASSEHRWKCQ